MFFDIKEFVFVCYASVIPERLTMPLRLVLFSVLGFFSTSVLAAEPLMTISVGSNPESVCRGFDGKLFVTLINGEEPGDGTIVRLDGDDQKTITVFAKGFNAPKGLVFVDKYLITADETTVWKIASDGKTTRLATKEQFPSPIEFLNDVVVSRDQKSVYVSEMSNPGPMFDPSGERKLWDVDGSEAMALPRKGCVYRIDLDGNISVAIPAGDVALRFPNGLAVGGRDEERLFVGDFFTGNILTWRDGKYRVVAEGVRGLDGLAVGRGVFYASSWTQGKVWRIDRKTKEMKVIREGMKTAADFYLDVDKKQLIIPDMLAGTLTFLPIE